MNNSEKDFDDRMKKVMVEITRLDKEVLSLMLVKLANSAACTEETAKYHSADPTELLKALTRRVEAHILTAFYAARSDLTGQLAPDHITTGV